MDNFGSNWEIVFLILAFKKEYRPPAWNFEFQLMSHFFSWPEVNMIVLKVSKNLSLKIISQMNGLYVIWIVDSIIFAKGWSEKR